MSDKTVELYANFLYENKCADDEQHAQLNNANSLSP